MRMKKQYRILDLYKNAFYSGIFYSLSKNEDFKELFESIGFKTDKDYHSMDFEYVYNHSGLKTVSAAVEQLLNGYIIDDDVDYVILKDGRRVTWDYAMTLVDEQLINFIIYQKFYNKWKKLIDTIIADYDYLSPYNMSYEKESTDNMTSKGNTSNNREVNNTVSDTSNNSAATSEYVYGFNSDDSVGTNENNDTTNIKRDVKDDTSSSSDTSNDYSRSGNDHTIIKEKEI